MKTKRQTETELEHAGAPAKTAELIASKLASKVERGDAPLPATARNHEDKRALAQQEHSNHFTSRADFKGK